MAAIGNATKHGFLVREGDALERLAKVSKITFDKTGTLTFGTPKGIAVESVSAFEKDDIFALTAAAEQFSEHPLGKAIVKCYGRKPQAAEEFRMIPGEGVTAKVDSKRIKAGNLKMITGNGDISLFPSLVSGTERYLNEGSTVIYVAVDDELAGYIVLSDTVREESAAMIEALGKIGVEPVLLTGDNQNAASAIAGILNPVIGVLVHNAGSVFVIINSSLLLGWKGKRVFEK